MRHTRTFAVLAAAAALAGGTGSALAAPAGAPAAAPAATRAAYCGITWGSLAKTNENGGQGEVTGLRAGRHECFDRLVVDVTGQQPGYRVSYVAQVYEDGSGHVVPLKGGAKLNIVVIQPAFTRPAMPSVAGYPTFRDVKWAGSFEGQTTVGLGVRARLPFRVFTLPGTTSGTSRLVIDVAHRW